jgi:ABC-2 type transport system permease protein
MLCRSLLNRALWRKAIHECRGLLASCVALMFAFHWIFVWITSMVKLGPMATFVRTLPEGIQNLSGVPVNELATVAGRIALAYVDPVVLFTSAVWAISRGSDAVSGEIDRGTMEMLLAQPIHRVAVLFTKSAVSIGGAACIALACYLGTWCGVRTVPLEEPTDIWPFAPAALNLFAMTVFLIGVSTAVSACDRYRWRTIGLLGGYYTLSLIVNVMARMVKSLRWLEWFTFFGAYEPQGMISEMLVRPHVAWTMSWRYDGTLLGLAMLGFAVAGVVFAQRDIPAPL